MPRATLWKKRRSRKYCCAMACSRSMKCAECAAWRRCKSAVGHQEKPLLEHCHSESLRSRSGEEPACPDCQVLRANSRFLTRQGGLGMTSLYGVHFLPADGLRLKA